MSDIILGIIIGMGLTGLFIYIYIRSLINRILGDLDKHLEKAVGTLLPLKVERTNGIIYCYSKEDNQFICQGTTAAEIREIIQKRFPEKTAFLDGGDEDLVNELREELKELNEVSTGK